MFAGIAAAAPEFVLPPEVVFKEPPRLGERVVCSSGTWKGAPKFEYTWVREGVEFLKGPTYTLSKADEHKELWCIVTATSGGQVGYAESINSLCLGGGCGVQATPPANTVPPAASGTPAVGNTLSCSQGTWTGTTPISYTYQWYRETEPIGGASSSSYVVAEEDETHTLACRVTAKNTAGQATAESNGVQIPGKAPENTKEPAVLGVPALGEALTCSEGTWKGSKPLTFKFQWLRNGVEISGGTGSTHVVVEADQGQSLSCRVTAKNGQGEATAVSKPVKVEPRKLENVTLPAISPSGSVKAGTTLSCSQGTWTEPAGELEFEYRWLRDKIEEVGKKENKYTVAAADRQHLLYCQVSAKNKATGQGPVAALSVPVSVLPEEKKEEEEVPKLIGQPFVSGKFELGGSLTCESSWSNNPTSWVYQWLREGAAIAGATAKAYKAQVSDEGRLISCVVIAQNSKGSSAPAESAQVYIKGEKPSVIIAPEAHAGSSKPQPGESLTCSRGAWNGAPPPTYSYEWLRDGSVKVGSDAAYTIAAEDRARALSCRVTAKNTEGEASEVSNAIEIPGIKPGPPLEATISGEPSLGSTLTCEEGTWTGAPEPEFSYQWLLNGNEITGATSKTLTIGSAYRGYLISCRVTGTNKEGSASVTSRSVLVAGTAPQIEGELPWIEGSPVVGFTLKCNRGIWSGHPPPVFSYEWLRDGVPIEGAGEATYVLEPADQGHLLTCIVIAANGTGSFSEESRNGIAIAARATQSTAGGVAGTHTSKPTPPSRALILAAIKRQLSGALLEAKLSKIRKTGSFKFSFVAPWEGKLETRWYKFVKVHGKTSKAHGKTGKARATSKQVVLALTRHSFSGVKKITVKLKLTAAGRRALRGKKHYNVRMKVSFTIPHERPVTWAVMAHLKH